MTKPMTAEQVIADREDSHGSYWMQASYSQQLKGIIRVHPKWRELTPQQKESVEMIIVKISRILSGSPNEPDHWTDIAGYATLVSSILHDQISKGTKL